MTAAAHKTNGEPYMPLKLKGALARLGIRQAEWAASIKQDGRGVDGKPLSLSAATQIMNWNTWPRLTSQESIKRQTEELLRRHGVDEVDIAHVWEVDKEDLSRNAHPLSVHVGQTHRLAIIQPEIDFLGVNEMLSADAKKHFRLFRDPFINDIQGIDDVYLSPDQRYIREYMFATAKHGGFLAVVGECGSGKTTLLDDFLERIRDENIIACTPMVVDMDVSSLNIRMTGRRLLESMLSDLSGERPKRCMDALTRQVQSALKSSVDGGYPVVLVIDEAHSLPVATLKMLKRLLDLKDGRKKLLSIILMGQPELIGTLNEQRNPGLREVIRRCEVASLVALDQHLEAYLALKLKRVDKTVADIFADDAFDAIRERLKVGSKGVYPLIVNNLVTKAMNLAAHIGSVKIGADDIKALK